MLIVVLVVAGQLCRQTSPLLRLSRRFCPGGRWLLRPDRHRYRNFGCQHTSRMSYSGRGAICSVWKSAPGFAGSASTTGAGGGRSASGEKLCSAAAPLYADSEGESISAVPCRATRDSSLIAAMSIDEARRLWDRQLRDPWGLQVFSWCSTVRFFLTLRRARGCTAAAPGLAQNFRVARSLGAPSAPT